MAGTMKTSEPVISVTIKITAIGTLPTPPNRAIIPIMMSGTAGKALGKYNL